MVKFRNEVLALLDPHKGLTPEGEGNREEILKRIQDMQKDYPNIDFGPLFVPAAYAKLPVDN